MGTIAEKLTYLNETKNAIKNAIVNKGVSVNDSDTFRSYADKISSIEAGGGTSGEDEFEAIFMSSIDDSLGANVTKLPSGLTSINKYAFYGCEKLPLTELPSGITSIENYAFYDCKKLALTNLPSGITKIGLNAFYNCEEMKVDELPSGITKLENYTFQNCKSLNLTKLPEGLTEIGVAAFQGCVKMPLEEMPTSLNYIRNGAFRYCYGIKSLHFKGQPTTIENYAFDSVRDLATIIFSNVTRVPTLSHTNAFSGTPIASGTGYIYVPDDLVESFKTTGNWKTYANQIKGLSELESQEV